MRETQEDYHRNAIHQKATRILVFPGLFANGLGYVTGLNKQWWAELKSISGPRQEMCCNLPFLQILRWTYLVTAAEPSHWTTPWNQDLASLCGAGMIKQVNLILWSHWAFLLLTVAQLTLCWLILRRARLHPSEKVKWGFWSQAGHKNAVVSFWIFSEHSFISRCFSGFRWCQIHRFTNFSPSTFCKMSQHPLNPRSLLCCR